MKITFNSFCRNDFLLKGISVRKSRTQRIKFGLVSNSVPAQNDMRLEKQNCRNVSRNEDNEAPQNQAILDFEIEVSKYN
jgi:hypothetical protein